MNVEHLCGDYFLYDGHILKAGTGEWGVVDAIRKFDAQHNSEQMQEMLPTSHSVFMSKEDLDRVDVKGEDYV